MNLLQNAIKFSKQNQSIVIDAVLAKKQGLPHLVQLKVSVKDSGIGMSKLDAINVFKPYYKTQNILSQKLNTHGHGLGLNICKKICESLGGSIEVETQL